LALEAGISHEGDVEFEKASPYKRGWVKSAANFHRSSLKEDLLIYISLRAMSISLDSPFKSVLLLGFKTSIFLSTYIY
jgi:hypothetical protein